MKSYWMVLVVALSAGNAAAFEAVSLADYSGAELFQRFCASCHGEAARGDGPVAPSLRNVVPDLTRITSRYGEFPAARIRETIDGRGVVISSHGTREMPVWGYEFWVEEGEDVTAGGVVGEAISRLVEYLREIQVDTDEL